MSPGPRPRALIVDGDSASRNSLAEILEKLNIDTWTASGLERARELILAKRPDVVLCDLDQPESPCDDLLEELADHPQIEVVLITGEPSIESAVAALRRDVLDYLTKPLDEKRLEGLLTGYRHSHGLKREVSSLRKQLRELGRFGLLVGTSTPMQKIYDLVERVAPTHATVLLVGESGTGKELVARTIHHLSTRRDDPILPLNCGAVAANLIESELFGHEKGAFTGADRRHPGLFERADGGTVFLDEITEMPMELQVKLLRVLETGKVLRVGGTERIEVDVRVLASTNRKPEEAVREKAFREDLYYRLNVFPIELPPLRKRKGDIPQLVHHFLDEIEHDTGGRKGVSSEAIEILESHTWPGNVRELKNVVRRAYILADQQIEAGNLPDHLTGDREPLALRDPASGPSLRIPLGISIEEAEKRLIQATLQDLEDDKKQAAEILGISLKTLYNRLKKYRQETAEGDDEGA